MELESEGIAQALRKGLGKNRQVLPDLMAGKAPNDGTADGSHCDHDGATTDAVPAGLRTQLGRLIATPAAKDRTP